MDKKDKRIITTLLITGSFTNPVVHKNYIKTSRQLDKAFKQNPLMGNILELELNKLRKTIQNFIDI